MIGSAIALVLGNLPLLLFVAAVLVAWVRPGPAPFPERLLDWLLLLAVGVQGLWAGLFHIFFPHVAAASIGWQVSPFQYEVGVADAAVGVAAVVSFWRRLDFKAAVVWVIVLFDIGVAIGHLRDALAGNHAANNFGMLLILTVVQAALLPWLLSRARARETA